MSLLACIVCLNLFDTLGWDVLRIGLALLLLFEIFFAAISCCDADCVNACICSAETGIETALEDKSLILKLILD